MRFFKDTSFPFIAYRRQAMLFSAVLIVTGVVFMVINQASLGAPFNFGIDFVGGTLLQVRFNPTDAGTKVDANQIRQHLKTVGFGDAIIQSLGDESEFLIRVQQAISDDLKAVVDNIQGSLEQGFGQGVVEIRRTESVGPQVGKDLRQNAIYAVGGAMILMLVYIAFRFQFRFGVGAVAALVHDVLITLGVFAAFRLEMNLPVVAALLTIVGYSLNDTIVVYDRIRENTRLTRRMKFEDMVNMSLNQTLGRTILTSLTTLMVVISLVVFGGEVIRTFSLALLVGVLIGTYSSVYVASPVLIAWEKLFRKSGEKKRRGRRVV